MRTDCWRRCWEPQWPSTLFAVALLASGQNSTITGTLAGTNRHGGLPQHPAAGLAPSTDNSADCHRSCRDCNGAYGERGAGGLLILSQVVLSLQLSFAVVPLVYFTSQRSKMGEFVNSRHRLPWPGWWPASSSGLNSWLLFGTFQEWLG